MGFLVDFIFELGGDLLGAEDLVLAVGEVGLEGVFGDGEGNDEGLPGNVVLVDGCAEAL